MTSTTKISLVAVVAIASITVGALILRTSTPSTPLPRIDFDTICSQTISAQPILTNYSGNFAIYPWEWGFIAVNVTSTAHWKNGVGKSQAPFCSPAIAVIGECYQSVTWLAASPTTPKWIVAVGTSGQCHRLDGSPAIGLQVWKYNGSVFAWMGLIASSVGRNSPGPALDGDIAYAKLNDTNNSPWVKFDLNAMAVIGTMLAPPVTPPKQQDVQGYTYSIHLASTNQHQLYALREGGPTPSPTFVPTATPTAAPITCLPTKVVTVVVTATTTPTKTRTPCIGPVSGCPTPCPPGAAGCQTPTRTRTP